MSCWVNVQVAWHGSGLDFQLQQVLTPHCQKGTVAGESERA